MSHLGLPYNREKEYEKFITKIDQNGSPPIRTALELAHYTDDVDVIITGGFNYFRYLLFKFLPNKLILAYFYNKIKKRNTL